MTSPPSAVSARGRWMTLTAALLGWMFDGLEMGLFPLVARPALIDLLGTTSSTEIGQWIAIITAGFLVGAATGGVLFGWLGDRIGRVRAMTLSILTYAVFSGLCGLASNAWQVAGFRFIASLGMGGEWSLGIALVMEVWPDRSRGWLAGVIGGAANFGYLIIGVVGLALSHLIQDLHGAMLSVGVGSETADWLVKNSGWRILMLFGALPALLTFLIRLFVPESNRWEAERAKGATSHWQTVDLLGVAIGATAAAGLIALWAVPGIPPPVRFIGSAVAFVVVTAGYLFPIVRYVRRATAGDDSPVTGRPHLDLRRIIGRLALAASLSGVALLGTWGATQQAPTWADQISAGQHPNARTYTQMATAFGAIIGCVAAALAGHRFGRRITYAVLCVGSLASIAGFYHLNPEYGPMFLFAAFLMGTITAAFYGWLPLYLPELFPTRIRATGQGFGFNFGRILAAVGVLQLPNVMKEFDVGWPGACTAMSLIYIVGLGLIWLAPETKGKALPS
jgi:MFS transporter, SHS family, sialic acid transporter